MMTAVSKKQFAKVQCNVPSFYCNFLNSSFTCTSHFLECVNLLYSERLCAVIHLRVATLIEGCMGSILFAQMAAIDIEPFLREHNTVGQINFFSREHKLGHHCSCFLHTTLWLAMLGAGFCS